MKPLDLCQGTVDGFHDLVQISPDQTECRACFKPMPVDYVIAELQSILHSLRLNLGSDRSYILPNPSLNQPLKPGTIKSSDLAKFPFSPPRVTNKTDYQIDNKLDSLALGISKLMKQVESLEQQVKIGSPESEMLAAVVKDLVNGHSS